MSSETLECACRGVRLVGLDAKEKADIGPLKSEVRGLEWASDGHLYIQLDRDILVASADGKTLRTVHETPEDGTILAMSISPSASHMATSIHTPGDNQVHDLFLL
jgi:WD40 repeat protein